jgi:ribosomal protein S18 acetylase RimI-like enzyme
VAAIRSYLPGDRSAVYDVCVRTGDEGGDARGRYQTDELLPDVFAGPYLHLEPERAFVLAEGPEVVGYVLGTAGTSRFVQRFRSEWLPLVAGRYKEPTLPPATAEEQLLWLLFHPERMDLRQLAPYPAHLHIDILPSHQGRGYGRQLIETFCRSAAAAGARAAHLAVARSNRRALGFYRHVGFADLDVPGPDGLAYLGIGTAPAGS